MSDSPLSLQEIRAAAAAYAELGPECSDAVVASFLARVDQEIAPGPARLADMGQPEPRGLGRAAPGRARDGADGSPGRPGMRSAVLSTFRWWAGPLLLAVAALAFDAADRRIPFGVWTTGPVDEVAHLSTAALGLLVLARFIDAPRRFYVAALIASVAIDVDHIPLYLGLLGNQAQRPVTHSLSTVAVFVAAAAASRRHRAVLAGVATGLVLHFARDIAEGYPGVRVFWPLQDTSWMVSYRWFLGMIVVFTATRLVLVSVGLPHARIPVFRTPSPSGSVPRSPDGTATSGDRRVAPIGPRSAPR